MPEKTIKPFRWKVIRVPRRQPARRRRFSYLAVLAALAVASLMAVRGRQATWSEGARPASGADGPTVRIGLVRDARHIRAIAYGGFEILSSAGVAIFTCAGPNVLRFSAEGGQPGTSYYYVAVAKFEKRQKPEARRLLAQLRETLKVGMELLETSPRLLQPQEHAAQQDRLLVAIGPFDDLNLAEQWKQYLAGSFPAYIVKDTSERATGEIHLLDRHDKLLARLKDSVFIRMKESPQVWAVEALQSLTADWAARSRTRPCVRGALEIRLNDEGRLTAIDILALEEYVKGIVPSEIGNMASLEALKAQAIAARSEALHKLGLDHHLDDRFDFCDKPHCQTYHGVEDQTARTAKAVEDTRGMVLIFANKVIDAVYCHSCGGVSADSGDVWRSGNYSFYQAAYDRRLWRSSPNLSNERRAASWLKSTPDCFCNPNQRGFPSYARKYFRWTRPIDGPTLEKTINRSANVGQILDMQVLERAESGRVRVLRVVGSKSSVRFTGIQNVSAVLGDVPSSFFILETERNPQPPHAVRSLVVWGGGFGHGVGLCQMGAFMMAQRGYPCEAILTHYYPDTTIRKAY